MMVFRVDAMKRVILLAGMIATLMGATSAAHGFIFFKPADYSGPPLLTLDPEFDGAMPGATPTEVNAILLWNFRSALNLAALQCNFEPLLDTTDNYNAMLGNHREELMKAYASLEGYFKRTKKPLSAAQKALDQFGTRIISKYSTVRGQLGFCETAGRIGHETKFVARSMLTSFAQTALPELRNAQKPYGEQQFRKVTINKILVKLPSFAPECYNKKKVYDLACLRRSNAAF
jgi:hypothetical protein